MSTSVTLAIDFGSSRTKVAYFDTKTGKPEKIDFGRESGFIIPSVFHIPKTGEGEISVGDDAMGMLDDDPAGVVFGLKREIHRPGTKRLGPGRPALDRIELASYMFRYIRTMAEREVFHGMSVESCVLTVPAKFTDHRRECIREAARRGGFVERRMVVEEPVAAAKHWLLNAKGKRPSKIIVCDVGGGTTDFALLELHGDSFIEDPEVPSAMIEKGGNDIDTIIQERSEKLYASEPEVRDAMIVKFKKFKELLKQASKAVFTMTFNGRKVEVPREVVAAAVRDVSQSITCEFDGFLRKCRARCGSQCPPILLVGGAARLEGLKGIIEELAPGTDVHLWNESDYATVLGAALEGKIKDEPAPVDQGGAAKATAMLFLQAEQGDAEAQFILGQRYFNGDGVPKDEKEAMKWYCKAAEQGHPLAQRHLATRAQGMNGRAMPRKTPADTCSSYDPTQLRAILDHPTKTKEQKRGEVIREMVDACEQAAGTGDPEAQRLLGECYRDGLQRAENCALSVSLFRMSAEQGNAAGQCNLALCYCLGTGIAADEAEGLKWARKAAKQGGAIDQYGAGLLCLRENEVEAAQWFRKAAAQGLAEAQTELGVCCFAGRGVPKNEVEATSWYRKAAEQGHAEAQNYLGICYADGAGVPKNDAEAAKWCHLAAEQGLPIAQCNLGLFYANGTGVLQSGVKAATWFRRAAEQGHAEAQNYLGVMVESGNGVPKNEEEAVKWYRKAAEQGWADAQANLGNMLADGTGVPKNEAEAVGWFHKAAEQGHVDAQNKLQQLSNSSTSQPSASSSGDAAVGEAIGGAVLGGIIGSFIFPGVGTALGAGLGGWLGANSKK